MTSARLLLSALFFVGCSSDPAATPSAPDSGTPPDGGPPADGGAIVEGCPAITGAGTTHDKNVEADETWTAAGSPHLVTDTVGVRAGATLTIEPCAEVRFSAGKSLNVADVPADTTATLKAEGTANKPIRFVRAAAEHWGHVAVRVPNGKATLRFVTMEGGGADAETMNATLFVRGPGEWPSRRDVLVDHVTIEGSQGYGAVVDRAAAFADASTDLVIEGAGDFPIRIGEGAIHTLPKGTYAGATNEILIYEDAVVPGSGLRENATMKDLGVPYRIGRGTNKQMRVEGATLTIEAGVTLRFEKDAGFVVHHLHEDADAQAAIIANGTAQKPVTFTSASATPSAGDWVGLSFGARPRGENELDHVRIEYAGADCLCGLATCNDIAKHDAAIRMRYQPLPGFAITNTTIAHSAGHGIHRGWQGSSTQSFLATNTFTNVLGCHETLPVPENGTCAEPKPACP